MRHLVALIFFLSLARVADSLLVNSGQEKEFDLVPNPHNENICTPSLEVYFEPYYLLTKPLVTQPDTFQDLTFSKVMSVPVPIYHMKQPARLSELELEFKLVLLRDLPVAGKASIRSVAVEFERAKDSWFPGYYWSPIVVYCSETTSFQHVGWEFVALDQEANAPLPKFYAFMVELHEKEEEGIAVRIAGFKAPRWMAARILS